MKNVRPYFYDNSKIFADGHISFGSHIDKEVGIKAFAAFTDKKNEGYANKVMFKEFNKRIRENGQKFGITESQVVELVRPVKSFFKDKEENMIITHLEAFKVGNRKFVGAVACRVVRDSLGDIAKIQDRVVFWFGCNFDMNDLTKRVKVISSTGAGVEPFYAVLNEMGTSNDKGTSFRGAEMKRVESGKVIREDQRKEVTEVRKAQMKAAKETFKAKKAIVKKAQEVSEELDSFELPEVNNEVKEEKVAELPKEEETKPMIEEKQYHNILINGVLVKMEIKKDEEEYRPVSNIEKLRSAFLTSRKPNNWDDYNASNDDEEYEPEELSDEDRAVMEQYGNEIHYDMYGIGYGCGVRGYK
ncbi:TPA: hypothetical protein ACGWHI_004260 [Salmonella enterica]|nr:hypothetical protein [Salmonella enterica subsp. enterica]